jgi:hypothetical protein
MHKIEHRSDITQSYRINTTRETLLNKYEGTILNVLAKIETLETKNPFYTKRQVNIQRELIQNTPHPNKATQPIRAGYEREREGMKALDDPQDDLFTR